MEMTMLLKLIQKLEHICMFFLRHGGIQILALFIVGEEIYQKYKAHNDKNSVCMSRNKNAANYAQTECQFRYCGTAIPFLTVRSTAR